MVYQGTESTGRCEDECFLGKGEFPAVFSMSCFSYMTKRK